MPPIRGSGITVGRGDLSAMLMETEIEQAWIGPLILPPFPVPKKTGNYPQIGLKALRQRTAGVRNRAPGGAFARAKYSYTEGTYNCKESGAEETLDNVETALYADIVDAEMLAAARARNRVMLEHEIAVKDVCHDTTTFPASGNTGVSVTDEWDDTAAAKPITDVAYGINAIRTASGLVPDTLQIAWKTWYDLSSNAQILDRLKYTSQPGGLLSLNVLAFVLGVERIIVGTAQYDGADDGQTYSGVEIWDPEYAFLFKSAKTRDMKEPCLGRTMALELASGIGQAEQYAEPQVDGEVYRYRMYVQEKRLLTSCGFLFRNIKT